MVMEVVILEQLDGGLWLYRHAIKADWIEIFEERYKLESAEVFLDH